MRPLVSSAVTEPTDSGDIVSFNEQDNAVRHAIACASNSGSRPLTFRVSKPKIITQANMIRAFAGMFLEEPHRTTRNFNALLDKVGKEIFAEGHGLNLIMSPPMPFISLNDFSNLK
jgi:hypothetical protein